MSVEEASLRNAPAPLSQNDVFFFSISVRRNRGGRSLDLHFSPTLPSLTCVPAISRSLLGRRAEVCLGRRPKQQFANLRSYRKMFLPSSRNRKQSREKNAFMVCFRSTLLSSFSFIQRDISISFALLVLLYLGSLKQTWALVFAQAIPVSLTSILVNTITFALGRCGISHASVGRKKMV